ncbi:hypothetical protein M407DRAFT_110500 [Tulasnella calospora MUT 4182]|uniref:Secreted protein n=1 Tax=Tulasnella calospora MUT 4182 TaxID=1051891 RepID=A0A0C3Q3N1_9AGAM|nr:hypothetical protein M407DRAFT_110500 [Tulasnella calospora MUT 4182]
MIVRARRLCATWKLSTMVLLLAALPYASTTEVIPQQRTLSRLCPWSTSQSCASSREVVSLRVSEGTVMGVLDL